MDVKQLQTDLADLTTKMGTQKEEYENQIAQMKFDAILDAAITTLGGRNPKAIKALLDIPSLMESKDQTADVQAAVNA